jgi:hypothetical protein
VTRIVLERVSERASLVPAPGSYNLDDNTILKGEGAASALRSKTRRFQHLKNSDEPGPGDYIIKSSIGSKKPIQMKKPKNYLEITNISTSSFVPSIPNKGQSFGYDYDIDGKLQLQSAQTPGYTGVRTDSVGPGDYDPAVTTRHLAASHFSKAPDRRLDAIQTTGKGIPGPGYYNTPTEFDLQGNDKFNPHLGTDIVLQLKAARKRQSHMFESSTTRKVFNEVLSTKVDQPGPGIYRVPSCIQAQSKPTEQQCFNSTVDRFAEGSKSNRINTAPGTYSAIQSDFDVLKSQILKRKKMHSKSGWAQNISFDATESRYDHVHLINSLTEF